MNYLKEKYGIKTAQALENYIRKLFNRDIVVVKTANFVKIIWAVDNKLHTYNIEASVIYVVQEKDLEKALDVIRSTTVSKIKK